VRKTTPGVCTCIPCRIVGRFVKRGAAGIPVMGFTVLMADGARGTTILGFKTDWAARLEGKGAAGTAALGFTIFLAGGTRGNPTTDFTTVLAASSREKGAVGTLRLGFRSGLAGGARGIDQQGLNRYMAASSRRKGQKVPINKLTAKAFAKLLRQGKPGLFSDGGKLYLSVNHAGATASWIFRYRLGGKEQHLGLGPCHTVEIDEARVIATRLRKALHEGCDPRAERGAAQVKPTFRECFVRYLAEAREANPARHRRWEESLTYCAAFAELPIDRIGSEQIATLLKPLWKDGRRATGARIQERAAIVFDYARQKNWIVDNPAAWKGYLKLVLETKTAKAVEHLPALSYDRIPRLMAWLAGRTEIAADALRIVILTACRPGDVLGQGADDKPPMRWADIDLDKATWTVNSKVGKFEVALSTAAVAILRDIKARRPADAFVFQTGGVTQTAVEWRTDDGRMIAATADGAYRALGRAMSDAERRRLARARARLRKAGVDQRPATLGAQTLRRLLAQFDPGISVHGTARAGFKTWADERTHFEKDVVETCLGHRIVAGNKVEAAYRRTDFFEKRRKVMESWADHCTHTDAKIVKLAVG
jgi:hypothetical protein